MHFPLLQDILILLVFSVAIVFILQRLRLPSILGFLLTGIIIGPAGLSLVSAPGEIATISEIGVILLLFVIGMELSLKQLASMRKTVFIGGFIQVGLTIIGAGLIYYLLRNQWSEAVFIGFLFSLSSTAIVLKVLQDRNEISTTHGRNALAILIFQDIIVVPMMLLTPIIAGQSANIWESIGSLILKSVVVIVITIVSARYLVPKLLYAIAKTRSKELFLLTTITLCFAIAYLTSEAGLSLALGAFLAGLIISESEYSHQATSIILPFRELFTSFFFISVGMLLNLAFFFEHIGIVLLITVVVFLLKSLITGLAVFVLKYPVKTIILTALSLFQVGEFAFILSKVGIEYGLLDESLNQYFLSVSITSMLITPFVIMSSGHIANWLIRTKVVRPFDHRPKIERKLNEGMDVHLENHLIIVGYGINGSNLAKAAAFSEISYVVVEMNAETVRRERAKGIPIIYGDASQTHILNHLNLLKARALVIAISDLRGTKLIISSVRSINQSLYLLVRTRYVKEITELVALGADEVIPEEFETSIEIFSKVLHNFLVPEGDIEHFINTIRSDNYQLFQSSKKLPKTFQPSELPEFNITCLNINIDSGDLLGKSLRDLNLREVYGINILGISRDGEFSGNIGPDVTLQQGDKIFVNGKPADVAALHKIVK